MKKLFQQYMKNGHTQILFTDERMFTLEEKFNRQNNRVNTHKCWETAEKKSRNRKTSSSSLGWKCHMMALLNYILNILGKLVKPLSDTLFAGKNWTFQEDSVPSLKAKKKKHNGGWNQFTWIY